MIIYLHSFKDRYAGRTFSRHIGMDIRHINVPDSTELKDIADVMVAGLKEEEQAAPEGLIDLLVIVAPGGPGFFTLSGEPQDEALWIDEHSAETFASPFARLLKPKNFLGEGVEIHGCGPGAPEIDPYSGEAVDANSGYRFIGKLAGLFAHRVKASADEGLVGVDEDYEDSLVEAEPSPDLDGETEIRIVRDMRSDAGFGAASRLEAMCSVHLDPVR
jgi:hypothetical protein